MMFSSCMAVRAANPSSGSKPDMIRPVWQCIRAAQKKSYIKGTSKNSEFAQMQGAQKISQRRIWMICKQEIFC
ncbi:MAG: hypothetical protein NUV63_01510, partial [Gallionella sp.]|nr:hypothetical protein [Gallionella sp.]